MKKFYNDLFKTQLKVGVFTVVLLAILVVSYLWLSNRISMQSQQELRISFDDVMGLEIGDKAMFRGMEVGRIKMIEARENDILVTAKIDKDISLKEGARFYITDSSLMGGTALNIAQGTESGRIDLTKPQRGDCPGGIMGIMGKATTTIDEINKVLLTLHNEGGLIDKSSSLLDDAGSAARSVDNLAIGAKTELTSTLQRIEQLTAKVNQIVNTNADNVNSLLQSSPAAMQNLNSTLDSLQVLSARLGDTVNTVNSGKGTAGRLINDDQLYRKLLDSVANLDSLVQDVKAHPKKYVKFSVF